jgi:hypothetical protein
VYVLSETCGCCAGTEKLTPARTENRPGLDALAYRVGTHATFFETMKARLSNMAIVPPDEDESAPTYPLAALTARDTSDFSIALLDGWATVGDVLTFYQERIANEGYLRTATERRSVLELARLVGYALRPGVAATAYLAFTIDSNFKETAVLDIGVRAQTVPGPGELPQSFETVEPLLARAEWNALRPRMLQPQTLASIEARRSIYLKGITTNLKPGDPLLVRQFDENHLARILTVEPDAAADRTLVTAIGWNDLPPAAAQSRVVTGPALTTYITTVRDVAAHYMRTDEFGVNASTKTATRILKMLSDLHDNVQADMSADELDTLLYEKLTLLRAEHEAAVAGGFTILAPWINGAITELNAAAELAHGFDSNGEGNNGEGEPMPQFAPAPGQVLHSEERTLKNVMKKLTLSPSVPPPNTLQLRRDAANLFAHGSDATLQVINAVRPELSKALPAALANSRFTPTSELEVYALRVKSNVYGSTAPKRPVFDSKGAVVGTQEWPIDGVLLDSISFDFHGETAGPFHANLLLKRPNQQSVNSTSINPSTPTSVPLGDLTVTFGPATKFTAPEGFTINLGSLNRILTFKHTNNTDVVTLTVVNAGATELTDHAIKRGETHTLMIGGRNVTLSHTLDTQLGASTISITEETALAPPGVLPLDAVYEQVTPGGFVAVARNAVDEPIIAQINTVQTVARNDYNFPAKVTQLSLSRPWLTSQDFYLSDIRATNVFAQSERLALADEPIATPICDGASDWIELDGLYRDLQTGRWLIVAGERADLEDAFGNTIAGVKSAELVMLNAIKQDIRRPPVHAEAALEDADGNATQTFPEKVPTPFPDETVHTYVMFAKPLAYCYQRDKVTIYGNVAKSTHGETRQETLGSGDGSRALQSFTLRQPPLTYVAAPTVAGAASTLHVFVNEVEWHETDTLAELEPTDHAFITKTDDEGRTTLTFGNGKAGARLPTGIENVRAVYRNGIGKPGNVRAEQISLLVTRPLGVKDVINPLRTSGGADKEGRDLARQNAPLAVTALDRLVSVQDYADFTRMFAGIGKAVSRRLTDGRRALVHLTIAGVDDIPIDKTSDLYQNLVRALHDYGSPDTPVRVAMRELVLLVVSANVGLLPDYKWEPVVTRLRATLLDKFSFARRELGQDAVLSELITTAQAVEGVAYVDVDVFGGVPELIVDENGILRLLTPKEISDAVQAMLIDKAQPTQRVRVNLAAPRDADIQPAQIALLSPDVPDTLILNQIK